MPVFDTPIRTDDQSLKKVLGQKQPAILVLVDGKRTDKALDDALERAARQHAGGLLVIRVDGTENPETMAKYSRPTLPALVTLTPAFFGRKVKSSAESIRPADVRNHIAHLLEDAPLPEDAPYMAKPQSTSTSQRASKNNIVVVSDQNFRREVLQSKVPVLVDFWAPWCGPCHSIAPYVEQVARQYTGKLKVAKLNTDANQRTAGQYGIRAIPTFIVFQGGQPAARFSGASPQGIQQIIADVLVSE
jgi:thioredoxin 1